MLQRKCKGEQRDCKSYGTIDFKFQDCCWLIEVSCIFHFAILRMERSNCFDIINSFCSTGTLNKLKITITISFAEPPYNIFKACLNLMC